ncbi:MAG: stage II sporulation protein P [Oscillospiraceae bacterium]|nr:stage II sporulation protein P [Oscillospiraceae bacterium]
MAAAVYAAAPPAEAVAFFAASASARLSSGTLFEGGRSAADTVNEPQVQDVPQPADKPRSSLLEIDDSTMLSYGALEIPSSRNEEIFVTDDSYDVGPEPYPESLESHDGAITAMSYGVMTGDSYIDLDIAGQVRNVTDIPNEVLLKESRLAPDFEIEKNGEPQVLIMHTHTTESYEPYERDFYDKSFNSRTTDERMNMIAVGNALAEQLEAAGIGVIHNTDLHDYPSYNGSYDRSRETVAKILEEYPSIKIVLDVHRDAIERESGERIAPTAEINGRNAAQVMIISGCDDGTMGMPDYMKNFRFACMLQSRLESDYEGLTRPILFDYRKYNQDMTTGSILIEVGGHANSIDQAVYSGELVGKALAECFT